MPIWWGSDIARRQGTKKFGVIGVFWSVTHLNNKVCERHFAVNALEYGYNLALYTELVLSCLTLHKLVLKCSSLNTAI